MSRNKREGRYAGFYKGNHYRYNTNWRQRKNPYSILAYREYIGKS